jgi:Bacterial Alpha-2-macroglobulin MG10 domain/Alpha-2-macroglobulin family/MG2 domain
VKLFFDRYLTITNQKVMKILSNKRLKLASTIAFIVFSGLLAALTLPGITGTSTVAYDDSERGKTQQSNLSMNHDYEKAWLEIDSLEQQGLPKSALAKTEDLLKIAKAEKAQPQVIKCLIYKGKYKSQLEEDGLFEAIEELKLETEQADGPARNILQSITAELYAGYLDNNYWRFRDRTQTVDFENDDLRTWTVEQLTAEASRLYLASLSGENLKSTPIGEFDILLTRGENSAGLRPTLFDFLANRAIEYFTNERTYLTEPAFKFEIENAAAFAPVEDFNAWRIESKDASSMKLQTLRLMQELLRFRSLEKSKNPSALLVADLQRLRFVFNNAVMDKKDSLYTAALERLIKKYDGQPGVTEVYFQLAVYFNSKGANYKPAPLGMPEAADSKKWFFKKAKVLCDTAIKKFPESYGAYRCAGLKARIERVTIHMETEEVNLPEQPFLAKLEYRNLTKAWLKVIRFDEKRHDHLEELQKRNDNDEITRYFNGLPAIKTWSETLPDDGDFRQHSVEIGVDGLPLGQYLLMVSDNQGFSRSEGAVGYLFTRVSNIGLWQRQGDADGTTFVVFDRRSGEPLKGVIAELWVQNYNAIFRKNEWKKKATLKSDEDGFINPGLTGRENRNFRMSLCFGKDTLSTGDNFYSYTYRDNRRSYEQTHFFLDRAIYRPGQTIYFKGIALSFDEKRMPEILKNRKVKVTLLDANYQEAQTLELATNEYGTFNGQFTAPRGGLLGNMQLRSDVGGNAKSFRVEEYKRPKFEVAFEPVTGSYRLDDTVNVAGVATAYAGSQLDGASVSWRVVREARFPWLPWWYRGWIPWQSETMEIANGVTQTDAAGKFAIQFLAQPDRSVPADQKPEFSFRIYAGVTDITGETHSQEATVNVGYISLKADVVPADFEGTALGGNELNVASLKQFNLITTNLGGQFEPAKGRLTLALLRPPQNVFLDRYWERPDRHTMSEAEFKKAFPHFAYGNEDQPGNWLVQRTVLDEGFDTKDSKSVLLPKIKLTAGWYALTLTTKDKYGVPVEVKKFISLYDLKSGALPSPVSGWHVLEQSAFEPGETAPLYLGTTEKELHALLEIVKDGEVLHRKWLHVKGIQSETYIVREEDRGNVSYFLSWAMHNRPANIAGTIGVPWTNKELSIEYGTFRDKLKPGEQEEWTLKLKGPEGEKIAAEMVVGMYDASLDAFAANSWNLNIFPTSWSRVRYTPSGFQSIRGNWLSHRTYPGNYGENTNRSFDRLNWFDWDFAYGSYGRVLEGYAMGVTPDSAPGMAVTKMRDGGVPPGDMARAASSSGSEVADEIEMATPHTAEQPMPPVPPANFSQVKIRSNLNETVFFYPNLMTDEEGNVVIKFKMNEALTRWKFLGLAHTQDLKIGTTTKEVVTQKELMVMPNPPRFFRENDEIEFTAKVVNLTDKPLSGNAQLQLVNPINNLPVFKWEDSPQFNQTFTVEANQSARLAWRFKVPDATDVPVIEHTVLAAAGEFSDAERSAAPVLTNRMLVTETLPLPVRGHETKSFVFNSLKNNKSQTLRHQGLTLEFTQNPAWYAVQALPYLMEYPYDCTEQVFSRFYANSLATSVANSHPKVKAVFDKWQEYQPEALESNLTKNQELKSALLEETPWVLQAKSEEQQKQNIALLFDLNRMSYEQEAALKKLQDRQLAGGGWPWFPGDRDNRYITQYIAEGLGHLQKLGVSDVHDNPATWQMVQKAVNYCDDRMVEEYERLEKNVKAGNAKWEDDHLGYMAAHYLYMRSFFLEDLSVQASTTGIPEDKGRNYLPLAGKAVNVHTYYIGQAEKYWLKKGQYTEGLLALALHRTGKAAAAASIVRSLKEQSLHSEEMGMYWTYPAGWWWYQAPIETHALMIEVFSDVAGDSQAVNELKVWLLKNKQTNHWKTTKATASATYALLSNGSNWLLDSQPLGISFGQANADKAQAWQAKIRQSQKSAEAGTGYFKTTFSCGEVSSGMAEVIVENPNDVVAWGAMYWQYFEQLDKITTFEETPLTLKKQLFTVENSATGEALHPIAGGGKLKAGQKLKVRIELRVDRDMEYVHMKDMRASGFEPINVLSSYKWQGSLGYYESTRDAATNFFFSFLPKGTYVFEYPLRVVHNGDFSNGVTTIQCMYAPEFTSHSEGIRVKVE